MDEIQAPKGAIKTNKIEVAQKTYFFERHDGSVIAVQEVEAWNLLKPKQPVIGRYTPPIKLIGVSDGTKFQTAVQEAHALHSQGMIEEAIARLRKGEEEEREAARGHIEMPRNFDSIDQDRRPFVMGQLGRRL